MDALCMQMDRHSHICSYSTQSCYYLFHQNGRSMKVRGSFRLTLLAGLAARAFLLAWSLLIIEPVTAVAGPKEDDFRSLNNSKAPLMLPTPNAL